MTSGKKPEDGKCQVEGCPEQAVSGLVTAKFSGWVCKKHLEAMGQRSP